jgi:hypothetical protein
MGYELHIRRDRPISRSEWEAAVQGLPNTRLRADASPGCSALEHQLDGEAWTPTVYFDTARGAASVNARGLMGDEKGIVWESIDAVCRKLGAQIYGDEGELFELDDGNPFF